MDCNVTNFRKVTREGALPYYVIKATGTKGDANASVVDEDGFINPMAVQSRTYLFTKTLFPGSEEQCDQLEQAYETDDDGNVADGKKIRLMLYQWNTGKKFYILNRDGELYSNIVQKEVEKVADRDKLVNGKPIKKGMKYTEMEEISEPKVFENISLTLYCDKEENCVEGNPEELAKNNWNAGLQAGTYIIVGEEK